jgi:putative PIN family toxin of toxin-antitoxin system
VTRAVLDSNVLVAGIPKSVGDPAEVVNAWRTRRFLLVTSEYILGEVIEAWKNRYWSSRFSPVEIDSALSLLRIDAEVTPLTVPITGAAPHYHDDPVISTAINGAADFLVTRDQALLALKEFGGVTIVSPREFLTILDGQNSGG